MFVHFDVAAGFIKGELSGRRPHGLPFGPQI